MVRGARVRVRVEAGGLGTAQTHQIAVVTGITATEPELGTVLRHQPVHGPVK